MPIVYLSIGSNLGSREKNCEKAVELLTEKGVKVLKRSSMIETEPWGLKEQPDFINMAVEIETALAPEELLKTIKATEIELGRQKDIRWGPRIVDLDILFYDDLILKTPELEIPHPLIKEREFVLKPLSEIAPEKIHPLLNKSVRDLLNELKSKK
ncbi:MAG: 2-amino-4-hydroxy-6-hydroxymethyldihydropteridine diphosphokinase [Nitrospirae bacterium]|nr:2-amino-4-hydroxy-6-hydroxymethyldihydropteridine diphosphokinase [Nitrospirota bacterium]